MTIFTTNNVPLPANANTIISESDTVLQTNGNLISTLVETKIPYVSSVNPTATIVTSAVTTIPATQTLPSSSSVIVTTTTQPVSVSSVNLIMSDGSTNTVFDSVATGLKLLEFMNSGNQYYLQASDDIMIINVDGIKLLIVETTFMNQKLMNSFTFTYNRGRVRCIHRTLSTIMGLTDALASVG